MSEFKAKTIAEISAHCINFDYALQNEYNKLLQAYTTTRAELATVKAELDRGKWVSVSELLPETNEDVLIWNETMPKAKISWYGKGCGEWGGKNIPVTFWMPIHELPI